MTGKLPAKRDRSRDLSGKLKVALDAMVEQGLALDEAAREGGLTTRGLRMALSRPAVLRYLKDARARLIHELRAGTPRRLGQLRDQDDNRAAAVAAGRLLEEIGREADPTNRERELPGLTIQLVTVAPAAAPMINITPARAEPASVAQDEKDDDETA